MFSGFSGCEHYAGLAHWQSTEANGAAKVRGDLCPLGRYGFDARCRGWYAGGKGTQGGHFHITAPYEYASSDIVGMSAAASLIDPETKEFIGETLIDFSPGSFIDAVDPVNTAIGQGQTGFPVIITSEPDVGGAVNIDNKSPCGLFRFNLTLPCLLLHFISQVLGTDTCKLFCSEKGAPSRRKSLTQLFLLLSGWTGVCARRTNKGNW